MLWSLWCEVGTRCHHQQQLHGGMRWLLPAHCTHECIHCMACMYACMHACLLACVRACVRLNLGQKLSCCPCCVCVCVCAWLAVCCPAVYHRKHGPIPTLKGAVGEGELDSERAAQRGSSPTPAVCSRDCNVDRTLSMQCNVVRRAGCAQLAKHTTQHLL